MPWSPAEFRKKHNKHLSEAQAKKASSQANAMLAAGVPEGEAIATANKQAHKSPKSMMKKRYKGE